MADSGCMLNGANYFNEEFFIYRMSKQGGGVSIPGDLYPGESLSGGILLSTFGRISSSIHYRDYSVSGLKKGKTLQLHAIPQTSC